jgi:predicted phosphodiesterase
MRVGGQRVVLTHTGLGLGKRRIGPDSSQKRLRQVAQEAATDILVCGCSHIPFAHEVDGVWLAAPGSVGLPGDGDPRASYAMLRIEPDSCQVDHFRIEYDLDRLVAAIRKRKLPQAFVQMFEQGLDLEAVLEEEDDE